MEPRVIFGADGIRGVIDHFPFKRGLLHAIGAALGIFAQRHAIHPTVVIGRDTRASGAWIVDELISGLVVQGADVMHLGVLTTPAVAYVLRRQEATLGIVVSASHSPHEYNGIKVLGRRGWRLQREQEMEIEQLIEQCLEGRVDNFDHIGAVSDVHHLIDMYISHHARLDWRSFGLPENRPFAGYRIVLDCADGAAGRLAPRIFAELGADVQALNTQLDGNGINHRCGSEHARDHPQELAGAAREHGSEHALAFDGDGDRLTIVDQAGGMYDGNDLLYVLARYFARTGQLRHHAVVTSELANRGLADSLLQDGIRTVYANKGDRNIESAMWSGGLFLGGEPSGNIIVNDGEHTAADAIFTALVVCGVLLAGNEVMRTLTAGLVKYPRVVQSLRIPFTLDLAARMRPLVQQLEADVTPRGRVLIWGASTEPGITRILVEGGPGVEQAQVERVAQLIHAEMRGHSR